MAPAKPSKPKGKTGASKKAPKLSTNGGISKRKAKQAALAKPGGAQKTKPSSTTQPKKKKRIYTEKELGIPKLNMITPAGVQKPKGKKKGKIFVDDQESMMTILAMVNADKEGQIESKMMKARQMEEIREARRKEAEARQEQKQAKLEETKDSLRKKRKHKSDTSALTEDENTPPKPTKGNKKRVSFG
ncbi:hypothetical protein AOQ84DRAFT_281065 [Glonium stellatum]|uniref:60S ribosomal subunit assembly/export protein LOC1 n=1 Tax=Glonium stellatum TaxID=574774 RepID=A0A8E2JZ32_9PEZI|nr:hypothetical protein AOQ84DRAFT_281065 [Glonium stellatum]